MKTKTVYLTVIIGLMSLHSIFGQTAKTEEFKVSGNCGMCESRIEKAANSVEGVNSADWDKETKIINVSFDTTKTDVAEIQKAIAGAGHDTELEKADDEEYNELPGCCQYTRE
jgi:copper chaperone CopZ